MRKVRPGAVDIFHYRVADGCRSVVRPTPPIHLSQDLYHLVEADATTYSSQFREETHLMMDLMEMREKARQERHGYGVRKWKMPSEGHRVTLFSGNSIDEELVDRVRPMQHHDESETRL